MKKYEPAIIAEIGLNHLGKEDILKKYINQIAKTDVDGISIQILKKKFYKGKYKKFILNNEVLKNFIKQSRKKWVGDSSGKWQEQNGDGDKFIAKLCELRYDLPTRICVSSLFPFLSPRDKNL